MIAPEFSGKDHTPVKLHPKFSGAILHLYDRIRIFQKAILHLLNRFRNMFFRSYTCMIASEFFGRDHTRVECFWKHSEWVIHV